MSGRTVGLGTACLALLLLAACISTPTSFVRDAPAAVYPAGELSGEGTRVFGWRIKF